MNGQVPFLVIDGDTLHTPHDDDVASPDEPEKLKIALLPFETPLCFAIANSVEPTEWDNAEATPFHNYRIDRPGAFVLVDGTLRPLDESTLFG